MAFLKEELDGISVITLSGKILTQTAQDLKKDFDSHCSLLKSPTLVDMRDVNYISSYFIGILIDTLKKHRNQNCGFYLSSLDPHIQFILKVPALKILSGFLIQKKKPCSNYNLVIHCDEPAKTTNEARRMDALKSYHIADMVPGSCDYITVIAFRFN